MTPLSTESTTARATAAWAGPNICTACFAPLIVTLLKRSVSGLAGRFGATTASSVVKPSLLFVKRVAEGGARRARLRADDQIDVRHLVAVADQRLAEKKVRCHVGTPVRSYVDVSALPSGPSAKRGRSRSGPA